jgi:hypothetical protein
MSGYRGRPEVTVGGQTALWVFHDPLSVGEQEAIR